MNASTAFSQCQVKAVRAEKEQLWGSMGAPLLLRGWAPAPFPGRPQDYLYCLPFLQASSLKQDFPAEELGAESGTSRPEKREVGFRSKQTSSSISQVSINPGWLTFHFFTDMKNH